MSQFIVNLALLVFMVGIIVTGIQILSLSENQKFIQQKRGQFIKISRAIQFRFQSIFFRLTRPLNSILERTVLAEPTKTEEKLTEELRRRFLSNRSFAQETLRKSLKVFYDYLSIAIIIVIILGIIYISRNQGLVEGILNFPRNFIKTVEKLANQVTTPLFEPFIKRYLE